jgi:hypothetical protein
VTKKTEGKKSEKGFQCLSAANDYGGILYFHFDKDVKGGPREDFHLTFSETGRREMWMWKKIMKSHRARGVTVSEDNRFIHPGKAYALFKDHNMMTLGVVILTST